MTRRGFFAALISAVAGATLDPERLLWVPGRKTIFIPPSRNVFVSPDWIAREMLAILQKQFMLAKRVNREFDAQLRIPVGSQIRVRRPIELRRTQLRAALA